jgi:hypothetical protein
VFSYHLVSR